MKIYVDGKEIECDEVRLNVPVTGIDGILEESNLHLVLNYQGLVIDLEEVTDRCNGSSSEVTRTSCYTYDELVDLF